MASRGGTVWLLGKGDPFRGLFRVHGGSAAHGDQPLQKDFGAKPRRTLEHRRGLPRSTRRFEKLTEGLVGLPGPGAEADRQTEVFLGLRDEEYLRLKVLSCMLPAI